MKKLFFVFSVATLLLFFSVTAFSEGDDYYSQIIDEITDEIPQESKSLLEKAGLDKFTAEEIKNIEFNDIADLLLSIFKDGLKEPLETLTLLLGIIILTSLCSCYITDSNISAIFKAITVIIISLLIFQDLMNCIARASTSLQSVCTLMKTLVPIIAAIASFSGTPTLAVSYNAITVYVAEIIAAVCSDFLTPVLMNFSVLSVCLTFNPIVKGNAIMATIKKCVNMILGFCSSVFTGISGIKNLLSSGIDKVSVKGVQFILGTSVPVVGGALSEGLSSILAAVSLMKSTVGIVGIILIIIVVIPITCELVLWSLVLSFSSYVCDVFSQSKTSNIIQALKFTVSMLLSVVLFCAYIFIVSTGMVILMGNK